MIYNSLNKRIIYRIVLFLFLFTLCDAYDYSVAESTAKNTGMSRAAGKLIMACSLIGEIDRRCVGKQCGDYDAGKTVR